MLISAEWDKSAEKWNLSLQRESKTIKIWARHIVLCAGKFNTPISPEYKDRVSSNDQRGQK